MPIVIMKTDDHPSALPWTRPHGVFAGTMAEALKWCIAKNIHPNNHRTTYEPVHVPNTKP